MPELLRQHGREPVAIGFHVREDDEANEQQGDRERREAADDDHADGADQRGGKRAGSAEGSAHGRHNGVAAAL